MIYKTKAAAETFHGKKKGLKMRTGFTENNFKFMVPQKMLSKCHAKVVNMIRYYAKLGDPERCHNPLV